MIRFAGVVLGLVFAVNAQATVLDDLRVKAATDKVDYVAQIEKGEQVFLTQYVNTSNWPKVWIYQIIDASPEEVAAVFFDYAHHKDFFPSMYQSDIKQWINPREAKVQYSISVPVVSDEVYTVHDILSAYDGGKSFLVTWKMLQGIHTVDTVGSIKMEAHGNKTIIEYYNFVTPGGRLARLRAVRNKALATVSQTAWALDKETVRRAKEEDARMKSDVAKVRTALGL